MDMKYTFDIDNYELNVHKSSTFNIDVKEFDECLHVLSLHDFWYFELPGAAEHTTAKDGTDLAQVQFLQHHLSTAGYVGDDGTVT